MHFRKVNTKNLATKRLETFSKSECEAVFEAAQRLLDELECLDLEFPNSVIEAMNDLRLELS